MRSIWMCALALPAAALAEEAPTPAPSDEIVVTAQKGMWSLEGKRIRAAQAALAEGQPRFGPSAKLSFQILLKTNRSPEGLTLTLRNGDEMVPVPIEGPGRFTLPPLDSDKWRLTANRTPAEMGVRTWVLSPGSTEADRRVGDLRLLCRVGWALTSDRYNFVQRAGFKAIGGCDTSRIMFYTTASRPLASAQVVADGKSKPVEVNGYHFRMPIGDKALSNDARVRLSYR